MPARRQARVRRRHDTAVGEELGFLDHEGARQAGYAQHAAASPDASRPTVVAEHGCRKEGGRGWLGFGVVDANNSREGCGRQGRGSGVDVRVRGYKNTLMCA